MIVTRLDGVAGGSCAILSSASIASSMPHSNGQFSSQLNHNNRFPTDTPNSPGNAAFIGNLTNSANPVNITSNPPLSRGRVQCDIKSASPSYPSASSLGNAHSSLSGINTGAQPQGVLMEPMRPWPSTGLANSSPTNVTTPTCSNVPSDPFASLSPLNQAWPSSPATVPKYPSMANSAAPFSPSSSGSFQRSQLHVNASPNKFNDTLQGETPTASTNTLNATTPFHGGSTGPSKNNMNASRATSENLLGFDAFSQKFPSAESLEVFFGDGNNSTASNGVK